VRACAHDFVPSEHEQYEVCLSCGTYHSLAPADPMDCYTPDYWTNERGHSTLDEQAYNCDVLEIGGKTKNQSILDLIDADKRGAVLEIGCAPGSLLGRLKKDADFVMVDGVEVPWAWDKDIQRIAGCRVDLWHGVFPDVSARLCEGFYNLIVSCDTFEHSDRPEAFLEACERYLKLNGQLILMLPLAAVDTPDRMWLASEHVYLHSLGNLRAMLEDAGLKLERVGQWAPGHDVICARRVSIADYDSDGEVCL
jgi:cyclopropane fatty-acyl-phospholipid synthase-like methyltransferase